MKVRPNKDARIMIELELMSQWATCQRGRVASALVNTDGVILVPARNGTPRGQPHCNELVEADERCVFCIHSEKNVINHAAAQGVRTRGHHLYTLKRPCLGCANDIVAADIAAVYYRWDYDTDGQRDYVFNMFNQQAIYMKQLKMTPQEYEFHSMIEDWRETWQTIN